MLRFMFVALCLGFSLGMAHAPTAPPNDQAVIHSAANADTSIAVVNVDPTVPDANAHLSASFEHALLMAYMSRPVAVEIASNEAGLNSDSLPSISLAISVHNYRSSPSEKMTLRYAVAPASTTVLNC